MFKSQESGSMKRVKVKGGKPRVDRALKVEVHMEEYLFGLPSSWMINSFYWAGTESIDITKPRY